MNDDNSFLDSYDESDEQNQTETDFAYQAEPAEDHLQNQSLSQSQNQAHVEAESPDSTHAGTEFDGSFGGLVPQESRKERRRREALERQAQQQAEQAAMPDEPADQDHAEVQEAAEQATIRPKKSPLVAITGLFKKKSRSAESQNSQVSSAETAVNIQLPMAAAIDPAMLYEYGLDPNTLIAMGVEPASLPQFDPQFLSEMGINPNIIIDILRRQMTSTASAVSHSETASETPENSRTNWSGRIHLVKKWAPAAAAVVGLSATGAIWFMASQSDEPNKIPEVSSNQLASEDNSSKDGSGPGEHDSDSNSETETLIPQEVIAGKPDPKDNLTAVGQAGPLPEPKPVGEVEKAAESIASDESGDSLPPLAAATPPGLPSLPVSDSPNLMVPADLPPTEMPIADTGEAPPLPPPSVTEVQPETLPTETPIPEDHPPVASINLPEKTISESDIKAKTVSGNDASQLPPIAEIGAAAIGVEALALGTKEAPPLASESLTGLPDLPISGNGPSESAKIEPPADVLTDSDLPPVSKELTPEGLPSVADSKAETPPVSIPGADDSQMAQAEERPEKSNSGSSPKAMPIKAMAGLGAGIGAAKVIDGLTDHSKVDRSAVKSPDPLLANQEKPAVTEAMPPVPADLVAQESDPANLPLPQSPLDTNIGQMPKPDDLAAISSGSEIADAPAPVNADLTKANPLREAPPVTAANTPSPSMTDQLNAASSMSTSREMANSVSSAKNRAGIPLAREDWPTIPNGRGRVLRSIASRSDTPNQLAMAGTAATATGAGMIIRQMTDQNGNTVVQYAQPISQAEIAPIKHVVQSGENFWTISRDYYGSGRYYKALWKANQTAVPKIDELHVGETIRIPSMESLDKNLIEVPSLSRTRAPGSSGESSGDIRIPRTIDSRAMRTGNETPSNIENSDNSMGAGTLQGRSREIISQAVGETTSQSLGRRHRVQEGETLRTIARDYLGNARRSAEIVTMNPDLLENERTPLQAGQILRMPADSTDDQSQ